MNLSAFKYTFTKIKMLVNMGPVKLSGILWPLEQLFVSSKISLRNPSSIPASAIWENAIGLLSDAHCEKHAINVVFCVIPCFISLREHIKKRFSSVAKTCVGLYLGLSCNKCSLTKKNV